MEKIILTATEIIDMESTIGEIDRILFTAPFNVDKAYSKIYEVNAKHPENVAVHNMIFTIPKEERCQSQCDEIMKLQADLQWKKCYLNLKKLGKTAEEIKNQVLTEINFGHSYFG